MFWSMPDDGPRPSAPGIGTGQLAVLVLMSAVAPIAITTYLPALPQVSREFGIGPAAVQLSLTAFQLGLAIGQLAFGPLSDRVGRRRPLLIGTTVCASAGLACALAPTFELLVLFRFVQGAAGAAGVVISRAVVSDRVRGLVAARVFAIIAAVQALGPVVAPLAGGLLAPAVGWRGVFAVVTAVTTAMAVGAALLVPESLPRGQRTSGTGVAMARSLLAVTRDRGFLAPALAVASAFGSMFGYVAASPFVVQGLLGFSTRSYSVVFAANAAALAASSAASARLVDRVGPYRLLAAGSVLLLGCTAGLVVVAAALPLRDTTGRILVLALLLVSSIALGQVLGNATSLALAATGTRAGAGSASLGAIQTTVGGLAAALVGLGGESTAIPMALTMTAFALLTLAAVAATPRGNRSVS